MELLFYSLALVAWGAAVTMAAAGIFCFLFNAKVKWNVTGIALTSFLLYMLFMPLSN